MTSAHYPKGSTVFSLSFMLMVGLSLALKTPEAHAATATPAVSASAVTPGPGTCDWSFAASPNTGAPSDDATRYVLADQAAGYWQAAFSSRFPVGTEFKIKGQYPATRNMSLQVTNSLFGFLQTIAGITDYQIVPDAGSVNPYTAVNIVDPAIAPGGSYTVIMHYGEAPADPKPNTIYLPLKDFYLSGGAILVYRIYAPFGDQPIADHGAMPLPSLYQVTANGDVPIVNAAGRCTLIDDLEAVVVQGESKLLSAPRSKPVNPKPIPAQPVPKAPSFVLWGGDDVIGQFKFTQWVVNADNSYVYTFIKQSLGDLVLVRSYMPSYSTQAPNITDPQVRYWSLCESAIFALTTFDCVHDTQAPLDSEGYANTVISIPGKQPANANAAHGFSWLQFGETEPGTLIFRYMSPSPTFAQAPQNYSKGNYTSLSQLMGVYYPLATYCAKSVFDAHTNAGETPAQVFAACQVGQ